LSVTSQYPKSRWNEYVICHWYLHGCCSILVVHISNHDYATIPSLGFVLALSVEYEDSTSWSIIVRTFRWEDDLYTILHL